MESSPPLENGTSMNANEEKMNGVTSHDEQQQQQQQQQQNQPQQENPEVKVEENVEVEEKSDKQSPNHTNKPRLDKLHAGRLETKKISDQEDTLRIEVTQWPDGEISKLRIFETGNSVAIFYEEYDKLEDVPEDESPARDPGLEPEVSDPTSPVKAPSRHFGQSERKHKRLQRPLVQVEDGEGITAKHATYFPAKMKRRDSKHMDVLSDSYYDMSSFPRGTLTLLNVRNFRQSSGMSEFPRDGTDRDADGLCALFLELGFIVERYDNPTKKIMTSALEIAAAEEKLSCCACAILTHGDEGVLYATDQKMEIRDITKLFRNKNLAGKPKIFLFQSCRSSDYENGAAAMDVRNVTLPCEADFLYAYSTVPGHFSWANSRQGSWFVQAICSVFRKNSHSTDAYKMLTRVNDVISQRKYDKMPDGDDDVNDKRRLASIVSQMRKDFYFFPPYGPLPQI